MDSGHLFKNKVKQEINTGKKAVAQPWIQEVYKDPQLEFDVQTKSKKKSANKNVEQEQPIESSMTLLEAEQLHASSPDYENMKEADIRKSLFNLAISNQNGKAVEKLARDQILDQHEKRVEIADRKELIEETKDEVREFMLNPLLEREALKEMSSDKKLFESETVIADLKTQLEKIRYSLLYLGGTEEEKSKAILPDQDDQAMFIQKLQAARLLFSYREARLSICSNEYFNGRDLSRVMATQSANGKKMRNMLEQSRQRFLRLLDCAEHLPERELKDDEIEAELSQFDEDYGEFEIKDNLDEIMGKNAGGELSAKSEEELSAKSEEEKKLEAQKALADEAELDAFLNEPVQQEREEYEKKKKEDIKARKEAISKKANEQRIKLEKELADRKKQKAEIDADEAELDALLNEQTSEETEYQKRVKELTETRKEAISKKANEQRRELERKLLERKKHREQDSKKKEEDRKQKAAADEAELNAFLDEPVQQEKEAYEKKNKADAEARKEEIAKKANEQRRELERQLSEKKNREAEAGAKTGAETDAEEEEFLNLLKDVQPMSEQEMAEFGQMMENGEVQIGSDEMDFEAEDAIAAFKQALKDAKPLTEAQKSEIEGYDYMPSLEEEKVQQTVLFQIPSELEKKSDNSYSGSIGKVEQKDTDELASEVKRKEVKRQLAEDLSKEKTNDKTLKGILDMLKKYAQINDTFGDAVTAYGVKDSNFDQITENLKSESDLLFKAVSALSDLNRRINDDKDTAQTMDRASKALVKKYYDRLKDQCLGKLTFDKGHKVHIARTSYNNQMYNGENAETISTEFKNKELLFSHEPCVNDVIQGEFNDCMLLSALTSMVHKDPEMIKNMMYDHGDSVTVRFFLDNKTGGYEPYYINVPKATTDKNLNSALWVRVMETAYSTFRIYTAPEATRNTANMSSWERNANSFNRLDGQVNLAGSPELYDDQNMFANLHWLMFGDSSYDEICGALMGVKSETNGRIESDTDYFKERKTNNMVLYLEQMKTNAGLDKDAYKESKAPKDKSAFKEYITDRIITKLLSVHLFQSEAFKAVENPEDTLRFFSKKATIEDVQDLLVSLGKVTTDLLDNGAESAEVVKYLKKYRLDSKLGSSLLKELQGFDPNWTSLRSDLKQMITERLALLSKQADKVEDLDHRGFGGEYTEHAVQTFDKIAGALAEGKTLGASTYAFRGNGKEVGLDGQPMDEGITYGHQYTILGVAEGEFKNAKYIKMRNPWGRFSKEYEVKGDRVVSKVKECTSGDPNHGIVYVELNEFMNKFRGYTIAPK